MLFGGERQSSRGGEIERTRIACQLPDHRRHIAAAQSFFQREQHILAIVAQHVDDAVTECLGQSGAIRAAAQSQRLPVLDPQQSAQVIGLD